MERRDRGEPQFEALRASSIWCPTCRQAQPVREHLLLVLPSGNQYDYRCAVCGTSVGSRHDGKADDFRRPGGIIV